MYRITYVQLYHNISKKKDDVYYSYYANIVINDKFVVRLSGDSDVAVYEGVPSADIYFWRTAFRQNDMHMNVDNDLVRKEIESDGFENNIAWIEANADEVFNPENATYRKDKK